MLFIPKPGQVFNVSEPEWVGHISVQTDLTVLPADDPERRTIGWVVKDYNGCEVYPVNGEGVVNSSRIW